MPALNIVLFVGAFLFVLFTTLFVAGSLVYLGGLIKEALQAMSRPRSVKASEVQAAPASPARIPVRTVRDLRRGPTMNLAGWLRPVAVGLGLLVVGFVAGTMSENAVSSLRTIVAPALQSEAATVAPAVSVSDGSPSAEARPAPVASDSIGTPAGAPRECSLGQGIATDCTFN